MIFKVRLSGLGWMVQDDHGTDLVEDLQDLRVVGPTVIFRLDPQDIAKGWAYVEGGTLQIDADHHGTIA